MNKDNCVVIFTPAVSRYAGGISNTAYYLSKEISKEADVTVFTSINENEDIENIAIISNPRNNIFNGIIYSLFEFRNFCKENSSKRITVISLSWRNAIVPFILKRFYKYHDIVLCHGNELLKKRGKQRLLEESLRKRILNNAKQLCANSEFTRKLALEIAPNADIRVIHPCQGEKTHRDTHDGKYILSIGRLEKRKGFQDVISAVSLLREKYPDIKYYIAGEGDFRIELQNCIKEKSLENNCILLGSVSEDRKKELISNCSLLIMPSFFDKDSSSVEGFGIVFLEANAYGKPVIGTFSGGIPDAIKDRITGLLIEERDILKISVVIDEILNRNFIVDKEMCYRWAEQHSYQNIGKQYIDLISSFYS